MAKFKINNRIDLGTDGSFLPGTEDRFLGKLEARKDGKQLLQSLVDRGAVSPVEEPKVTTRQASKKKAEPVEPDPEEQEVQGEPDYEPTGQWELQEYGGGMVAVVNPEGFTVDSGRGVEAAKKKLEKHKSQS